jgi:ribosomal-protein-alanine N-acetyltransferase
VKLLDYIFCQIPTLETERTYLRKLLYTDKADIFEYAKNPRVSEHVLWYPHKTEMDTIEFLNLMYYSYNKNECGSWGIELKETRKIIGTIGFANWNRDKNEGEVGYVLAEEYSGKGIATEALEKVIKFGFTVLELNKIFARSKPVNVGSLKVLVKCGFKYEGLQRKQIMIKGKMEDMDLFSIIKEDWENN